MRPIQLHHFVRMIRMREINDVDVAMTVEEIKEVVEAMEVVDKSIGTKTKVRPVSPVSSHT
jgi:hypothetical protein